MARTIDSELEGELSAAAERAGCELLQAKFAGNTLRLILDRPEGVTLTDCEAVSKRASAVLDSLDFGSGRYLLEVSSPGLDRELFRPADYERFTGRQIRVRHRTPEGKWRTVVGRLAGFDSADGGRISVEESERGETLIIELNRIETARLEVEI